jgi:hypothetical protein
MSAALAEFLSAVRVGLSAVRLSVFADLFRVHARSHRKIRREKRTVFGDQKDFALQSVL